MKKILLIILCLASLLTVCAADMSKSIEYSQLYITGDAIEVAWDLGKAPEMAKINDGVFEWGGKLEGGKEFKFMNTRQFLKHIVGTKANQTVELGKTYTLNFFVDKALPREQDFKFKVAKTGEYTIIVDLHSMRMVVNPKVDIIYPDKFYATGSALGNKVIELHNMNAVEFKKMLTLKPGNFKLMDTPTEIAGTTYYVPCFDDVDITFGFGYRNVLQSSKDSAAKGWNVALAGDYTFYVINDEHTAYARLFKSRKVLYLVGGCCEFSWNYSVGNNCHFIPNPDNPKEMIWEGELRQGWERRTNPKANVDEPDKFKILTTADWNSATYHPYVEDAPVEGESGVRITAGPDWKWCISKDGKYRLTLNTKTEILKCEYIGAVEPIANASSASNK